MRVGWELWRVLASAVFARTAPLLIGLLFVLVQLDAVVDWQGTGRILVAADPVGLGAVVGALVGGVGAGAIAPMRAGVASAPLGWLRRLPLGDGAWSTAWWSIAAVLALPWLFVVWHVPSWPVVSAATLVGIPATGLASRGWWGVLLGMGGTAVAVGLAHAWAPLAMIALPLGAGLGLAGARGVRWPPAGRAGWAAPVGGGLAWPDLAWDLRVLWRARPLALVGAGVWLPVAALAQETAVVQGPYVGLDATRFGLVLVAVASVSGPALLGQLLLRSPVDRAWSPVGPGRRAMTLCALGAAPGCAAALGVIGADAGSPLGALWVGVWALGLGAWGAAVVVKAGQRWRAVGVGTYLWVVIAALPSAALRPTGGLAVAVVASGLGWAWTAGQLAWQRRHGC